MDSRVRMGAALAAALDPFGLGVLVVEPRSLRVLFANEAFGVLVGSTVDELLALPRVGDRITPEHATEIEARLGGFVEGPFACRFVHASGAPVELDLCARPFEADRGGRALVLVGRRAEERREREALERALDDASAALRARDDVISMASHELRSPLTSLRLHVHALARAIRREPPDGTRARRSIDEVERHTDRLNRLIDQLLDAARLRSGRLAIERAPVDLGAVVREVATRFGPEAARSGSTIILDGERSIPGTWDPFRLDQIVTNLLSNAIKYGDGSPVAIELSATTTHATLSVRDHGPGIAPEEHDRIFEPFERASGDPRVRGAGLGLWIVRRLVEAHGGSVAVISEPGSGAEFVIVLPRADDAGAS